MWRYTNISFREPTLAHHGETVTSEKITEARSNGLTG
jgi:hypothetical protein